MSDDDGILLNIVQPVAKRQHPRQEAGASTSSAKPRNRRQKQKFVAKGEQKAKPLKTERNVDPQQRQQQKRGLAKRSSASVSASASGEVFSSESFSELSLHEHLISSLQSPSAFGMQTMTAIQRATIPHLLQGRDAMVKSQTGSGKTMAYAIPLVQGLQAITPKIDRSQGPFALVLLPTRELALQTYDVFSKLLKSFIWVVPGYLAGGEKKKSEKARLRKGINVLIATPGRLVDHLDNTCVLNLKNLRWMIFDEADRLLDGGFEKDLHRIIGQVKQQAAVTGVVQSVLLSATLNPRLMQLAELTLKEPVFCTPDGVDIIKEADDELVLPTSLSQQFLVVPARQRLVTLVGLILQKFKHKIGGGLKCRKMLVFLSTQDSVDFHYYLLDFIINGGDDEEEKSVVEFYRLHGKMSQQERTAVYREFTASNSGVLLSTDVAARGLHVPQLDLIVQYNTPGAPADYVHRVGRTARVGRPGEAVLFLMPDERPYLDTLRACKITEMTELPIEGVENSLAAESPTGTSNPIAYFQRRCELFIESRSDVKTMAEKAYTSFVRAYSTYSADLRQIFNVHRLHLGHVAASFALRESPRSIGAAGRWRGNEPSTSFSRPGGNTGDWGTRKSVPRRPRGTGGNAMPMGVPFGGEGGGAGRQVQKRPAMTRQAWGPREEKKVSRDFGPTASKQLRRQVDLSEYGSGFDSIDSRR